MMETSHDAVPVSPVSMPASPVLIPATPNPIPTSPVPMPAVTMQTDAKEVEQPAKKGFKRKPTARKMVLGAIVQLKNAKGSSFADIKKYLVEKYDSNDIGDVNTLKLFLEDAVARGILEKINSRYKIVDNNRGKMITRSKAAKSNVKSPIKRQPVSLTKKETSSAPKSGKASSSKPSEKRKNATKEVKPEAKKRARKAQTEHVSNE